MFLTTLQNTSFFQVYYVRQGKDGTPEGNLSFTLQKQADEKVIGKTIVNDGQNICVLALCKYGF